MNTLIAVIAFVVLLAVPVGAIIATFRPTKQGLGGAVMDTLSFDPRHPELSYR